jgi:hypothetical protein
MFIPANSGQKPRKIELKPEPEFPLPGFYRAVFIDSFKIFFDKDNLTALVFVTAAVCFKFFTAGACCMGAITYFAVWGYLLGFYLNIIYQTALDGDKLPEIEVGTSITFLWYIFRPILTFAFSVFILQLPFIIVLAIFREKGATWESIWQTRTAVNLLLRTLFIGGLFLFPMAILAVAIIEDLPELFRIDRLITPIFRAIVPYTVVVGLLAVCCYIETIADQYKPYESSLNTIGNLGLNLVLQAVAITAMRSIGLLYRHYGCYFRY